MKSAILTIIIFGIIFLTANDLFAQRVEKTLFPKISLVSSDAVFIDTIFVEKISTHKTKAHRLKRKYFEPYLQYKLKLSIILHSKGDLFPRALRVRTTSPGNVSQIFTIEENLRVLNLEETHNYELYINTKETGRFNIELGSFDISDKYVNSKDIIIYDKSVVNFEK